MSNQHNEQWSSTEKTATRLADVEDKDWEMISHSDLYEECISNPQKCGVSAAASFKVGWGENKKEVFAFHFHTGGRCEGCRRRHDHDGTHSGEARDGWEEETVVGDDDEDRRGGEQRGGTVSKGKGPGAT